MLGPGEFSHPVEKMTGVLFKLKGSFFGAVCKKKKSVGRMMLRSSEWRPVLLVNWILALRTALLTACKCHSGCEMEALALALAPTRPGPAVAARLSSARLGSAVPGKILRRH